jgi:hypothetical protein
MLPRLLGHPDFYSVFSEADGAIAGSDSLDERSPIVGLGQITVVLAVQNRGETVGS